MSTALMKVNVDCFWNSSVGCHWLERGCLRMKHPISIRRDDIIIVTCYLKISSWNKKAQFLFHFVKMEQFLKENKIK
jgi:hypothetical protein